MLNNKFRTSTSELIFTAFAISAMASVRYVPVSFFNIHRGALRTACTTRPKFLS